MKIDFPKIEIRPNVIPVVLQGLIVTLFLIVLRLLNDIFWQIDWLYPAINTLILLIIGCGSFYYRAIFIQFFMPLERLKRLTQKRRDSVKATLEDSLTYNVTTLPRVMQQTVTQYLNVPFFRHRKQLYYFNLINDLVALHQELIEKQFPLDE